MLEEAILWFQNRSEGRPVSEGNKNFSSVSSILRYLRPEYRNGQVRHEASRRRSAHPRNAENESDG